MRVPASEFPQGSGVTDSGAGDVGADREPPGATSDGSCQEHGVCGRNQEPGLDGRFDGARLDENSSYLLGVVSRQSPKRQPQMQGPW